MIASLGRALILLGLLAASAGAVTGLVAGRSGSPTGWAWTRRLAYLFSACLVGANLLMIYALLARDFSVSYVAQVGSKQVPDWVAVTSLWSSLEGSILFWGMVMGAYVGIATWTNRNQHAEYMPYATGIWLACAAFFSFLLAGPAQPFLSVPQPPLDGPARRGRRRDDHVGAAHPQVARGLRLARGAHGDEPRPAERPRDLRRARPVEDHGARRLGRAVAKGDSEDPGEQQREDEAPEEDLRLAVGLAQARHAQGDERPQPGALTHRAGASR